MAVDAVSNTACVAGFAPGPLAAMVVLAHQPMLRPLRFTTNPGLMELAIDVVLAPPPDRAVFYAEDEGVKRASAFVAANPEYMRLDELLAQTPEGRQLAAALLSTARPWSDKGEIWWELSHRLARAARGKVQVFGPPRLVEDRPIEEFRHKYQRNAYANTVFEKVEWPELEQNPAVTEVYYNGVRCDG
ncbi:hypothetical protein ASF43_00395 [Pseudorhodoferax sp. Leaf267]|nr:hypothetical protein ASF43_00395 [Pseudorhodoferax sp. Leaf267]